MIQEFVQAVHDSVRNELRWVHTAIPGTILSYDANTGLATVLPSMMFRKPDGSTIPYPQITGVPVVFQQSIGQQVTVAFPVQAGDGCLLIVSEQSIDYWLYGQETDTDLAFDLSNAICIPGLFNKANGVVKDAVAQNAVIVDVKGTRMTVKRGKVQIDATDVVINGNVTVNGWVNASGDVKGEGISLAHHTHTCPDGSTSGPK